MFAVAVFWRTGAAGGTSATKAGGPRPVWARLLSGFFGLFYCRCPSAVDAVAVLYTPCPLMCCCHLDREGLACVALLVFLLK